MLETTTKQSAIKLRLIIFFVTFFTPFFFYLNAQCTDPSPTGDCDGDGVPNDLDPDDDNDGIYDIVECAPCPDIYTNAGFEANIIGSYPCLQGGPGVWCISYDTEIDGWESTTGEIEIWSGTNGLVPPSPAGGQFAELNANYPGAFYQSMCVPEGATVHWSIWHRGRDGIDAMEVYIGESLWTANLEQTIVTGTVWTQYSGTYIVPPAQTTLVIVFSALYTSSGIPSVGNFIDEVAVGLVSSPNCDPDGDGFSNHIDLDSDGDLCSDVIEANYTDQNYDWILGDDPTIVNVSGIVIGTSAVDGYQGTTSAVTDGIPSGSPDCAIYLPTEFCGFTQWCENYQIGLKWEMCSEENLDYFLISGSDDIVVWENIAQVDAVGNSTNPLEYELMEERVNDFKYVRLEGITIDGDYTFSKVMTLDENCSEFVRMNTLFNPQLVVAKDDEVITLYDIQGKIVHKEYSGKDLDFGLLALAQGCYYLMKLRPNSAPQTQRVIIR